MHGGGGAEFEVDLMVYFKDFFGLHSTPIPATPSPPPLEVGPLQSSYGVWERCKLPQRGLGRSPSRILDFGAF